MTRLYRTIASASAAAGALALAGCAVQPTSTILSRLPEPAAATGEAHALTPAERKRYDEIDRQVLREQNDAIAADAAMRAWSYYAPYYAPPPVTFYGGYSNGGWGPRWGTGFGYGYPGW
ncbi:conserved exported protein of unknown function [Burkholderia multivorans]